MPDCSAASARLRATSPTCMRRNSSKIRRRLAASSSRHRLGPVDRAQRRRCGRRGRRDRGTSFVERIGEPARAQLAQRVRDERAQLPGEDLGLARLRVDRHDHAGLLVGGARPADDVDDRVRHLPLAAVHVELAEERGFGADA